MEQRKLRRELGTDETGDTAVGVRRGEGLLGLGWARRGQMHPFRGRLGAGTDGHRWAWCGMWGVADFLLPIGRRHEGGVMG